VVTIFIQIQVSMFQRFQGFVGRHTLKL